MKKLLVAFSIILGLSATAQEKITEQRSIKEAFTGVSAHDGIEIELNQSDVVAVTVTTKEQKDMDRLKTVVENGVLKIYYDNKNGSWNQRRKKINVTVSLPSLTKISISDGCSLSNNTAFNVNENNNKN